VERFGPMTAGIWMLADALAPSMPRVRWTRRARWSAYGAATLRAAAIALATRRAVRRNPERVPDVIQFGHDVHTFVFAGLVGPGRFVHHAFRPPSGDRPRTVAGRAVDTWAQRAEAARRRAGGGLRIAAATQSLVDAWARRAPYLAPVVIGHAMSRDERIDADPRTRFGIDTDAKVALVFGADHGNKDLETVWRAFVDLPDWTLLVVGDVAGPFHAYASQHDAPDAVVVEGYVDDATRSCAHSAADLVVLSFHDGHVRDSGVFQDALAFGKAVVCSDGSDPANKVREFGVGCVFEPGNASALVAAVRAAPAVVASDAMERALGATTAAAVARAHLDALDELARGRPDEPGRGQAGRK
jgi:glycosyltransferase involved in cell wall biosynthesis